MMDEAQNDASPQAAGGDAGSAKGGAKLIRGNGADGGPEPTGEGGETKAQEAASAAAGVIRQAGRRAAVGAEAVRRQAEEGAEALGGEAARDVQAAAAAVEDVAGAGGGMLGELLGCTQRASLRNAQALAALLYCRTPFDLLHWQSNLLSETLSDLRQTNSRILRLASTEA